MWILIRKETCQIQEFNVVLVLSLKLAKDLLNSIGTTAIHVGSFGIRVAAHYVQGYVIKTTM